MSELRIRDLDTAGSRRVGIACIGAGPAAAMLLERIIANHARDWAGLGIDIHLVDPHRPGGGRIWRREQSPLLKLNSMLEDVAFFTDASCTIEGPVAPGPSLAEWVVGVRDGRFERPEWSDALLDAELDTIGPQDFPTRRLNNAYLSWAFDETLRRAGSTDGEDVAVTHHRDLATMVEDDEDGRHVVTLGSGSCIRADLVIYALGHSGTDPSPESRALAEFAERHGLDYISPAFTADVDLDGIVPGTDVIVRGMGLAAIDLTVLLTEGRGGRFQRNEHGGLDYLPSGREPRLHLGSRRGVPYRSKITSHVVGAPVTLEYLGADFRQRVAARVAPLDFERDVRPLIGAEFVTGYYRELFTGHPDRVERAWAEVAPRMRSIIEEHGAESVQLAEFIADIVPDPDDRFDLDAFYRPLAFASPDPADEGPDDDAVHDRVLGHIATDLRQRTRQEYSATMALFLTALYAFMAIAEIAPERWNARSRIHSLPHTWFGMFSYLASGPPGHRLEELIALAEAGVVRFIGGDIELVTRDTDGLFRASGTAVGKGSASGIRTAHASVTASVLVDAWLPEAHAAHSDNLLLRNLVASGRMRELAIHDADGRVTTGEIEVGTAGLLPNSDSEFAIGPFVAGPTGGAFTRPGLDSLPFRVHDRCARAVLRAAARLSSARATVEFAHAAV